MKKVTLFFLYLILYKTAFSQQIKMVRDIGFWSGLSVEKKILKDFEFNIEQQIRFYKNATKFDDYIIDFGSKYKLNKNFKLGSSLRYTYNAKRTDKAENNYRYNLDLKYKIKLNKKLQIDYRLRYQQEFINLLTEYKSSKIRQSGVRNRVQIEYKINKKNELYFSSELFKRIELFKEPYHNKIRFYIGDNLKTKIGYFDFSFAYEQEINTVYPLSFFFFSSIYTIKL